MPPHPKKHHFVPQFLLRRFADSRERLVVHRITADQQFASAVANVGHRNFGHTLYRPGREPDHTTMEAAMANIEGEAATAIRELAAGRGRDVPLHARRAIAWLAALQRQRSRFLLHFVTESLRGRDGDFTDQEAQTSLLRLLDVYVISSWSLRDDPNANYKDQWNSLVSWLLAGRQALVVLPPPAARFADQPHGAVLLRDYRQSAPGPAAGARRPRGRSRNRSSPPGHYSARTRSRSDHFPRCPRCFPSAYGRPQPVHRV